MKSSWSLRWRGTLSELEHDVPFCVSALILHCVQQIFGLSTGGLALPLESPFHLMSPHSLAFGSRPKGPNEADFLASTAFIACLVSCRIRSCCRKRSQKGVSLRLIAASTWTSAIETSNLALLNLNNYSHIPSCGILKAISHATLPSAQQL